jgi:hypothetical protein
MLLTPHILAGVAIISVVPNPIFGFILVLSSHYFLDFFPQKEYSIRNIQGKRWKKSVRDFSMVFSDIALGFFIVFIISGFNLLVFAAACLAIFPDSLTLLYLLLPKNKILAGHHKIHAAINAFSENKNLPAFWGVASQVIVAILAISLLLQRQTLL